MSTSLRQTQVKRTYNTSPDKMGRTWWSRVMGNRIHLGWDANKSETAASSLTLEFTPQQACEFTAWMLSQLTTAEWEQAGFAWDGSSLTKVAP